MHRGFDRQQGPEPRQAVGVELQARPVTDRLLDRRHQRAHPLQGQDAGRIGQRHRLHAETLDRFARLARVQRVVVARRDVVAQQQGHVGTEPARGGDAGGEVVIAHQRIEQADLAHAVGDLALDEQVGDVVGHREEAAHQVAANGGAQGRARDALGEQADAFERVLVEEQHAGVELHQRDGLHRQEAGAVHALRDRQHVLGAHAGRPQALLAVAQRVVGQVDGTALAGARGFRSDE